MQGWVGEQYEIIRVLCCQCFYGVILKAPDVAGSKSRLYGGGDTFSSSLRGLQRHLPGREGENHNPGRRRALAQEVQAI